MLRAWRDVLTHDETFSLALSPEETWLTAFHSHVAEAAPRAAFEDGTVDEASFYSLLEGFLDAQVLSCVKDLGRSLKLTMLHGQDALVCALARRMQDIACHTSARLWSVLFRPCCCVLHASALMSLHSSTRACLKSLLSS